MLDTIANLSYRKKMEDFVDHCELKVSEEVARLFKEYTLLVWDYKLLGKIYDFYTDDAIMYVEDGKTVVGVEKVVADTLAFTAAVPDNESWFIDIFAEGDEENGYRFIQATRCVGTCLGRSAAGEATGRSLSEGGRDCIGLCECLVKKVDGRWKIVEEWMVRSNRAIGHVMTPGSHRVSFEDSNPAESDYTGSEQKSEADVETNMKIDTEEQLESNLIMEGGKE